MHVLQEPTGASHVHSSLVQFSSKLRGAKEIGQLNLVAKRGGHCAGENGAAGPALQLRAALLGTVPGPTGRSKSISRTGRRRRGEVLKATPELESLGK